jgi:threonine dehydrogenase-like Zn-dependent dehydrogenase
MLAAALGARVTGYDVSPERMELARSLGIDVVDGGDAPAAALHEQSHGVGFEVALECSGNPDARVLCLESARRWGRVVFVGEGGSVTFDVSPLVIHPQLTLSGSWVCSIGQMEQLVDLLVRWGLKPDRMVTDRFEVTDADEAYRLADSGAAGKIAIVFDRWHAAR